MKTKQVRNIDIQAGATLIYNDGREGHSGMPALVLAVNNNIMTVQFEDRADTTTIRLDDNGWMNFLTVQSAEKLPRIFIPAIPLAVSVLAIS